ncbi:MAG: ABC transporter substrate-binding protein [Alphaproteobacteria bacterium]|nr:ABC transporter substrate-binding protein [Alphaproteobacteria bacterium]
MSHFAKFTAGLLLGAAMVGAGIGSAAAQEEINLVLNWVPGGDHAPIYWAEAQGWYDEVGIDLIIENGTGSGASAKKVGVGRNQVGIADLPTALRAIGQGADIIAVMNIYANSPYGIYWRKSSGIETFADLQGKTIGNPPFDAARQMWPAIAKVLDIEPDSVKFVNIKPNAKAAALTSGSIDATTNFYNVHYIYQRIFGDDLGFVALRDLGFNPYSNSIIANGEWAAENDEALGNFVSVTQRAYATCVVTPEPCIETLAKAGSQKVEDVTQNWRLVVELMTNETSVEYAIGYFAPDRMQTDYEAIIDSFEDITEFDIAGAYTNKYLDMSISMPESGLK